MIIEKQTCADHPRRAQVRAVGQAKTHRMGNMRRHAQQGFPFRQCLFD
jgi:hypothetical protein